MALAVLKLVEAVVKVSKRVDAGFANAFTTLNAPTIMHYTTTTFLPIPLPSMLLTLVL